MTGLLVGTWAVTVDGGSGIPGSLVVVCQMDVVVEVAFCGVALSVGIRATGVALERMVKPAMVRAQTKSCMISLWIGKKKKKKTPPV